MQKTALSANFLANFTIGLSLFVVKCGGDSVEWGIEVLKIIKWHGEILALSIKVRNFSRFITFKPIYHGNSHFHCVDCYTYLNF